MVILGFLVMMIILVGLLYLYYRQMQLPTAPEPPKLLSTFPKFSIADLHAECLENPLKCEVDEIKTTVAEDGDIPYYDDIYGFKTNIFERGIEVVGDRTEYDSFVNRTDPASNLPRFTCDDTDESPHCDTMTNIHDKTLKISYEALKESMNNCKVRLPGDRFRRKNYNSSGIQTAREPTYLLTFRNIMIDGYAEPKLDEMITSLDAIKLSEDGTPEMTLNDIKKHTEEYKNFLNVYATGKAGNGQGITKCDYYVDGCTQQGNEDVCHSDAISKHEDIRDNRPPLGQNKSDDIEEFAEADSGIFTGGSGVTNQQLMFGSLTDEQKEELMAVYPEAGSEAEIMSF